MTEGRDIGPMIRFHRKKAKLTQAELAKISGVGKTVVFDIEQGKETVRLSTLMKILHTLNIGINFSGPLMHLFGEKAALLHHAALKPGPHSVPAENYVTIPKKANVFVNGVYAGDLEEIVKRKQYRFTYLANYRGEGVSLTMPVTQSTYVFDRFPPFFEGLLPEGPMLEALLKKRKIDADDRFEQLMRVGKEMVGNVSVERAP